MQRVQIIIAKPNVTSIYLPGNPEVGTAHWVTAAAARLLIEQGLAHLPGSADNPALNPRAAWPFPGPKERPRAGPAEGKSSGEAMTGPTTASP